MNNRYLDLAIGVLSVFTVAALCLAFASRGYERGYAVGSNDGAQAAIAIVDHIQVSCPTSGSRSLPTDWFGATVYKVGYAHPSGLRHGVDLAIMLGARPLLVDDECAGVRAGRAIR